MQQENTNLEYEICRLGYTYIYIYGESLNLRATRCLDCYFWFNYSNERVVKQSR